MANFAPLFFINQFVDMVQDAKNKAIETMVYDDKLAKPLRGFVEAQRTFTKEANRSVVEFLESSAAATKTAFEKATKTV